MSVSKESINAIVWKACDGFRGSMDSSKYKDYILSMLFVKYLSDFYKEKLQILRDKYNGDEERIKRSLAREKFVLDESCTFEYLLQNKEANNLGEIINKALAKIEEDNPSKLDGIFRNVDFNDKNLLGEVKERNAILRNLLEVFDDEDLDLSPSKISQRDVIGDAYEFLISEFASDAGKKGGEFFTPSEVSALLAKLVSAKEGDRIYDPTCGSGSLLIKVSKEVGSENFAIYGQEKNSQTHSLCRMNMYLHEINDAQIEWGDTIRNPLQIQNDALMKFDVIVANPPFSLDQWGVEEAKDDRWKRFASYPLPPKSNGDYAFILHMIHSLAPYGRMGVVLPHGVLFRGSNEGKIRKQIIDENLLDAVIGLPANLFYGTSIPACILIFKKDREDQDILFIDASKEFQKGKRQNKLTEDNINKIFTTYHQRQEIEKYSHIATIKEIQENDCNLNIPRYVDTYEEEEEVDIPSTLEKINHLNEEIAKTQKKMDAYLKELGLA
ncbi:type I restriction-modification system subunit M [Helicobacter kayseriensis]|uniref:type I restriction-modification system subunit M n=1 Tax=Helicobacter kayseriensis TaxID=2905877 RepID=UPI001E43C465|nr:type I restriction-modification system subunit M [Helicobacter kayseriensis]MCE3046538.1 type I restriction-modification system subunit M [Helicobacter kayseriensis]MCE3048159.1 type I restriction-modification system subunit M [Helicobacter kayseriensis]